MTAEAEGARLDASTVSVTTERPDGTQQVFALADHSGSLESKEDIPEPHDFKAIVRMSDGEHEVEFDEHEHHDDAHEAATLDHNIRSAYFHVMADAVVSALAIIVLSLARTFCWLWMDPLAGVLGALVIANWSYGLMRDNGAIPLETNPDRRMAENVRNAIEDRGDKVVDQEEWRMGPGHMSAVVSVTTSEA